MATHTVRRTLPCSLLVLCLMSAACTTVAAHFVFVVPAGTASARVLLSETLQPDPAVDIQMVAGARLSFRSSDGVEHPVTLTKEPHAYSTALPPDARGVIHGVADLGVMTRGDVPHVLLYYPKTILGNPFDVGPQLANDVPVELVPRKSIAGVQLQLLGRGLPLAAAEVTVLAPDGTQTAVTTDADGLTGVLTQSGQYGAWARHWEARPGVRDGQPYKELRHYATLVFDTGDTTPR